MKKFVFLSMLSIFLVACSNNADQEIENNNYEIVENQLDTETLIPAEEEKDNVNMTDSEEESSDELTYIPEIDLPISLSSFSSDEILNFKQRILTEKIFLTFNDEINDEFISEVERIKEEYDDTIEEGKLLQSTYDSYVAKTDENFADLSLELLVLVNKSNSLPYDYDPQNLRVVNVLSVREMTLKDEAATATEEMFAKASEDGVRLVLTSSYRAFDYQTMLFERKVSNVGSFEAANAYVALQGESEHQTGLVIDITADSVGLQLLESFDETAEYAWLSENAADFGFILRYLKDREDDTGYSYEPWHYRYVGSAEIAHYITDNGLILEEYLDEIQG